MPSLALWALSRLLPVYTGSDSKNVARSLRRRFAAVGAIFGITLVLSLWDWTANPVLCLAVSIAIGAGLLFYSERMHRLGSI